MKVVIFEAEEWEARACRALSGNHELTCVKERLTSDNAAKYSDAEVISTFINSRHSRYLLRTVMKIKLRTNRPARSCEPTIVTGKPLLIQPIRDAST